MAKRMPKQKPGKSQQDVETPPEFLVAVKRMLHIKDFTVDLAATEKNSKGLFCITPETDSLAVDWSAPPWAWDDWCWLNPPFADIEPWVAKCALYAKQGVRIAVLLPASVGAGWFRRHVEHQCSVLWLSPRLTFVGHSSPYPKDLMLCLYDGPRRGAATWNWETADGDSRPYRRRRRARSGADS